MKTHIHTHQKKGQEEEDYNRAEKRVTGITCMTQAFVVILLKTQLLCYRGIKHSFLYAHNTG